MTAWTSDGDSALRVEVGTHDALVEYLWGGRGGHIAVVTEDTESASGWSIVAQAWCHAHTLREAQDAAAAIWAQAEAQDDTPRCATLSE